MTRHGPTYIYTRIGAAADGTASISCLFRNRCQNAWGDMEIFICLIELIRFKMFACLLSDSAYVVMWTNFPPKLIRGEEEEEDHFAFLPQLSRADLWVASFLKKFPLGGTCCGMKLSHSFWVSVVPLVVAMDLTMFTSLWEVLDLLSSLHWVMVEDE